MSKRPNILWIQTDEQRPDSLGCYGSNWAKTPNIDKIAKNGVVMKNAVCQSPVCLPSRSSQLSARYPQEFGCLNNMLLNAGGSFPDGYITFPEIFKKAGYETLNFGRFHCLSDSVFEINKQMGDALPEYCTPFDLNEKYDEDKYNVLKRPGKQHRQLIIAGTYPGNENPSQISTDRAITYLSNRNENDKPFLMRVSYNWPHTPTLAPPPFDNLYDSKELPIKYYNEDARLNRSKHDKTYAKLHRMDKLTKREQEQVWKDYMGVCAYVDSQVGKLISALEKEGYAENTIILYSSDHGKLLGEWGAGEKNTFDKEVWRVPFIWSFPDNIPQNEIREELCEIIDTGTTLLSLAGLEDKIPESYRGRNLFGNKEAPEEIFGVIRPPIQDIPDFDPELMRVAVRTKRYRMDMNWCMDGGIPPQELEDGNFFDLKKDPEEIVNIWDENGVKSIKLNLKNKLKKWLSSHDINSKLLDQNNVGELF